MILDFNKRVINSDKFRALLLHFQRHGYYISLPEGTTEYGLYWREEGVRCLEGYTLEDGDYITGFHYFYLNYCPINRVVEYIDSKGKKKNKKDLDFPSFYDYDYHYFNYIEDCQANGKHLCVLKSRRKGYSFKNLSMLCRNYYLIPGSKGYVYASDKLFLIGDGIVTKAWNYMDFVDEHTEFSKKRQVIDRELHRRASFLTTDGFGNKVEQGFKSEIILASLKSDLDKLRGRSLQLIFFEEAGTFDNLSLAWAIARPSVEQDGETFGILVAFGTGGSEGSDFLALKDMFYNPSTYNIMGIPNLWDENLDNSLSGFFCPQYANLEGRDDDGVRKYMDEDGNTKYVEALAFIEEQRKTVIEGSTNASMVDRYILENAITPLELALELSGNIFPKKDLQHQLAMLRSNKKLQNYKQVGDLVWGDNGTLIWKQKKYGDIVNYPLKRRKPGELTGGDDPTGSIVIWEHPVPNLPLFAYIAATDPYNLDEAGTDSLGSTFIYKRFSELEGQSDIIVLEYTGRPKSLDEYHENVRRLLTYYHATCLYENMYVGMYTYFRNQHCDYLLLDQPDIIKQITPNSKVNRVKGIHLSEQIQNTMWVWIRDWLNEEFLPGRKRLSAILSEPLLEELISFNKKGNFDRVISFGLLMVYIHQLQLISIKYQEEEERQFVIPQGLFSKEWFQSDETWSNPKCVPII